MSDPGKALAARGARLPAPGIGASTAVGESVRTLSLPTTPESAGRARLLVSAALTAWGLEVLEDAAGLVATELVTNAIRHAARTDTVRVTVTLLGPRHVRVAVVDRSVTPPVPRAAGPEEETGRGLEIVDALCTGRWGVDLLPWGKRVWGHLEPAP